MEGVVDQHTAACRFIFILLEVYAGEFSTIVPCLIGMIKPHSAICRQTLEQRYGFLCNCSRCVHELSELGLKP